MIHNYTDHCIVNTFFFNSNTLGYPPASGTNFRYSLQVQGEGYSEYFRKALKYFFYAEIIIKHFLNLP